MKICLSKYWKNNFICGIFMMFILFIVCILTIIFCDPTKEDYILTGIMLSPIIGGYVWVEIIALQFIRYIKKENKQLVMYSFFGKKMALLDFKIDVYYEILPLIEGVYSTQKFIVLSNIPFESYKNHRVTRLGIICKLIDKNGTQIIMLYNNQTIHNFLDISEWYSVN